MKKLEKAERMEGKHGYSRRTRYHTYLKKMGRKIMRRLGKELKEDAPKKLPNRGWEY